MYCQLGMCVFDQCCFSFRAALARQLAQDECYGRVQLPWTDRDLPGLTAALTSSLAGIEELCLPDTGKLYLPDLKQLFDALACSKCVRTFRVTIKGNFGNIGAAFCEMLKVNQSIDFLDLTNDRDGGDFVKNVSYALAENVSITKIVLRIDKVCGLETVQALSYLLAHNQTVTNFFVEFKTQLSPEFLEEFSQGLLHNKTIVKFKLAQNLYGQQTRFPLHEAVHRNRGALNRAVDFVISPSLDRQCAEGFEHFSGRPCLLKHLKKSLWKNGAGNTASH
ncbi:hypothetical protein HPB48_025012 [Haemaphysalis longicornis]|uniref:Uncharacterized protein n=1 Tax=Haemaphysalis longicornis TaxID=44386 RepID=A0A9J6H921_HAELO|nr:hypothetical protein HPB48_025012 [Haemaphysalis longicornis]